MMRDVYCCDPHTYSKIPIETIELHKVMLMLEGEKRKKGAVLKDFYKK